MGAARGLRRRHPDGRLLGPVADPDRHRLQRDPRPVAPRPLSGAAADPRGLVSPREPRGADGAGQAAAAPRPGRSTRLRALRLPGRFRRRADGVRLHPGGDPGHGPPLPRPRAESASPGSRSVSGPRLRLPLEPPPDLPDDRRGPVAARGRAMGRRARSVRAVPLRLGGAGGGPRGTRRGPAVPGFRGGGGSGGPGRGGPLGHARRADLSRGAGPRPGRRPVLSGAGRPHAPVGPPRRAGREGPPRDLARSAAQGRPLHRPHGSGADPPLLARRASAPSAPTPSARSGAGCCSSSGFRSPGGRFWSRRTSGRSCCGSPAS